MIIIITSSLTKLQIQLKLVWWSPVSVNGSMIAHLKSLQKGKEKKEKYMNVKLIKYKSNANSVCLLAISVRRHVMCEVV